MIAEKSTSMTDLIAKLHQAIADKDLPLIENLGQQIKESNDQLARTSRKIVQICNITAEPFSVTRTFGYVHISGKKESQKYTLTPIREYHDRIVYDDKHFIPVTFPAAEVAEDIVKSCNDDAGDDQNPSYLGVFLCSGEKPTAEELNLADARLRKFDTFLVRMADANWSRNHNYREISDAQRRAATRMNLKREWVFEPESAQVCPACGHNMPKGAAVHGGKDGCGAILDVEKARQYGLIQPEIEPSDEELDALTTPKKGTKQSQS